MKNISIESVQEINKYGFNVTYDGDKHEVLYGVNCNRCGEYFENKIMDVYCDKCKIKITKSKRFMLCDGVGCNECCDIDECEEYYQGKAWMHHLDEIVFD